MKVGFLADSKSWIYTHVKELISEIKKVRDTDCLLFNHHGEIKKCDIIFIIGYLRMIPSEILSLNAYNMVIHESDLPQGKGFSPMAWQIIEGKNEITFTMFSATQDLDGGDYYLKRKLILDGNEMYDEWRYKQAQLTKEMILELIDKYPNIQGTQQSGHSMIYRKRTFEDDEIDPTTNIVNLFDHVRVCDPENFPAWFSLKGRKYKIKLEKY